MSTTSLEPLHETPRQREGVHEIEPVLSARWVFRGRHLVVCVMFALVFAYVNSMPLMDSSIWLHMTDGAAILDQWGLPKIDAAQPLSEGMRVVHTSWLSKVIYAAADRLGGPAYVSNVFAVAMLLNLLLLARVFYLESGRLSLMVAGLAVTLVLGSRLDFFASPEVYGQICFALLLLLITRLPGQELGPFLGETETGVQTQRCSWPVWLATGGLFAAWANLHASFLLGIVVLVCYAAAKAMEVGWKTRSFTAVLRQPEPRRWVLLAEWALLASFLNPYGPRLIWDVLEVIRDEKVTSLNEWLPLNISAPNGLLFLGSLAFLAVVMRHSRRRVRPAEVLLLAAFGGLAVPSAKALGWYAVVYAYVVIPHLAEIAGRMIPLRERVAAGAGRRLTPRSFSITLVCALVLYAGFRWAPISREFLGGTPRSMAALVGSEDLFEAAEYLRANPSPGLVYAPVEWADWLVWRGKGDVRVLMTSNVHWAPRRIWSDHYRMADGQEGWHKGMDRYGVETLVIDKQEQSYFAKLAERSPKYRAVYENDSAVVLRRLDDKRRSEEIGKLSSGRHEDACCPGGTAG